GARVWGVDSADTADLRQALSTLQTQGAALVLGATALPSVEFDLAVVSPSVPDDSTLMRLSAERGLSIVGELELGFQQINCLSIAVAGTNGKTTTAELVNRVLTNSHRKTLVSGHHLRPICTVVEESKQLDYLILQVDSFQLQHTEFFRPTVAVLLNLAPDHLDRYPDAEAYVRASARLFRNQQVFDWAIVQSEALARLHQLGLPITSKTITFSATDASADLYLDRGLIISRISNWSGPLLDTDHCQLRGPHNAENLMAALAVGHVLRL